MYDVFENVIREAELQESDIMLLEKLDDVYGEPYDESIWCNERNARYVRRNFW